MSVAMMYERDLELPMRDGALLRANVYRPTADGSYPVVMTVGPYGKDLHMSELHAAAYLKIEEQGQLLNWETANPEWWVPQGYAIVRVDQRGTGGSPGLFDCFSETQNQDYYDAIEWAATQPWSSGKVGLLGVSYYAWSQWQVASLQPPHLTAMIPWEGAADMYRDFLYHGGIHSNGFIDVWWANNPLRTQHGADKAGRHVGEEERAKQRVDLREAPLDHPLDDDYYQRALRDLSRIEVPFLSAGNWGGITLHLRGNTEAFAGASSKHKWLRMHTGTHFEPFHLEESRQVQKRFFDYWLKGQDNGVLEDPPVCLAIRKGSGFTWRAENEWPIARTQWTELNLDARGGTLGREAPRAAAEISYEAPAGGASFSTPAFEEETEITGPIALRLWVSSTARDMDIFATLRNIDASGQDVWGEGSQGEQVPVTKGWLRVSHRKLDARKTLPYRPFHTHDQEQFLEPGEVVPVDVEIWPTSMVFEAGSRLVLDVEAHDGVGSGRNTHDHPRDRLPERFAGRNTIYTGGDYTSFLLLPIVPSR